jgi:hypothetical protein
VEGGELADDGSGEGTRPDGRAGEGQDPEVPKPDRDRGAGEPGGAADELLRRQQELPVVVGEGVVTGVEAGRGGERDRAAADADGQEVGIGGAPLPEAVSLIDDRPEPGWVGMEMAGHGDLGRGQVVGPPCDLGEVAEVAAPGAAGGPAFDQAEGEAGGDRGRGRGDDEGDQPGGAGAGNGEQERERPAAADQRHQPLEPAGRGRGGPADRRRGRHRQRGRRHRPRVGPHRPVHKDAGALGTHTGALGTARGGSGDHRARGTGRRHARTLRLPHPARAAPCEIVDNPCGG